MTTHPKTQGLKTSNLFSQIYRIAEVALPGAWAKEATATWKKLFCQCWNTRGHAQLPSISPALACIMAANSLLANASNMTEPKGKGGSSSIFYPLGMGQEGIVLNNHLTYLSSMQRGNGKQLGANKM